jgi:hypothetical protein
MRHNSIRLHLQTSSITISPHFGQIERIGPVEFWNVRLYIRPHIQFVILIYNIYVNRHLLCIFLLYKSFCIIYIREIIDIEKITVNSHGEFRYGIRLA